LAISLKVLQNVYISLPYTLHHGGQNIDKMKTLQRCQSMYSFGSEFFLVLDLLTEKRSF